MGGGELGAGGRGEWVDSARGGGEGGGSSR